MFSRLSVLLTLLVLCTGLVSAQTQSAEPPPPESVDLYPPFDKGLPLVILDPVRLVEAAAAHNPELDAFRDSWRIAEALIPQAQKVPDPMFTVQYAQVPGFANPRFIHNGYVNVGLAQVIPGQGKIPARSKVAELEVAVRHRLYEEKLNQISTEIRRQLTELYLVENLLQINRKHQFMIDHLIRVANIQYSVGKGAQPDVIMAQTERTKLERDIAKLWGRRGRLRERLEYLVGSGNLPEGRAPEPPQPESINLDRGALMEMARLYRPQLAALETQIEKAEARLRVAETSDNPDVTLAIMNRWFQYRPDGVMFTVSVPLPFFSQEAYEAKVVEQEREKEKAESLLREALAKIDYGLSDKLEAIESTLEQLKITDNTLLLQARQLFRGALKSYETGKYDFASLIRAQHTLLSIELAIFQLRNDAAMAVVEIEGLVGVKILTPSNPRDERHF